MLGRLDSLMVKKRGIRLKQLVADGSSLRCSAVASWRTERIQNRRKSRGTLTEDLEIAE